MTLVRRLSWLIEPVVGIVFTALWLLAEVGRSNIHFSILTFGVAIALARVAPIVTLTLIPATLLAQLVVHAIGPTSTDWPVYFGIPIAIGLVTAHARRSVVGWALGVGLASAAGAVALMVVPWDGWLSWTGRLQAYWVAGYGFSRFNEAIVLYAVGLVTVALAWGAGLAFNLSGRLAISRAIQGRIAGRLQQSEVELAVAQERNRIAQEMHDVLAHSLAVIVAQADGARYLGRSKPATVDSSLERIAISARAALVDVRGIIDGILEGATPPQPGLADLPELVASVGSAGVDVRVTQAGESGDLAPGQQLAVYRIVQEGLTNAIRHRGRGSSVAIVLDWRGPGLSLQLVSSGAGEAGVPGAGDDTRPRRGIEGMRERARLAGGWLAAGDDENGEHRLTAFVPYRLPSAVTGELPVVRIRPAIEAA